MNKTNMIAMDINEWELQIKLRRYFNEYGFQEFWKLFNDITYQENKKHWKNKVIQYELICPAVTSIIVKDDLNHHERTALMFLYLKLGKKGEERLWEILRKQKNFKESICKTQIENYKEKGKMMGISCEKMMEWGICNEEWSDCHKYNKIKEEKNDESI